MRANIRKPRPRRSAAISAGSAPRSCPTQIAPASAADAARPDQLADRGARRLFDHLSERQAPGADHRSARRGAEPQADHDQLPQGHHRRRTPARASPRSPRPRRRWAAAARAEGCRREVRRRSGRQRPGQDPRPAAGAAARRCSTMSVGQATPPFGSVEDGVRVLVLCGRDDPRTDAGPHLRPDPQPDGGGARQPARAAATCAICAATR